MKYFFSLPRLLGYSLLLVLLYATVICIHGYCADWDPIEKIALKPAVPAAVSALSDADSLISFVTWNVGYGGLGKEADFCYDDEGMLYSGSSMVFPPKEKVEEFVSGAVSYLKNTQADFFLLQEVDSFSKRSHHIPQFDFYRQAMPAHAAVFAPNYRCERVPIPVFEPWNAYGDVISGLGTFCRFTPTEAVRYQLPGKYGMPDRMFQLDRCVSLQRFPTKKGKDLVVINIHNSAYDPGDKIKKLQLPYLHDLAVAEYEKGNYVVVGGDWNQCPPFFRYDAFFPGTIDYETSNLPAEMFPTTWVYAYDPTHSTNRKTKDPYVKGTTFETLIDFFLVSPNVKVRKVKGIDLGFSYSDHQPVYMEVVLGE